MSGVSYITDSNLYPLPSIQHGQRLPMKAGAEPARQFLDGADPFAGGDCVTDPVNTAI